MRCATLSICHVERREYGSMPLVGSSKMITLLSPMRAMPTHSLRFMPPLSDAERDLAWRQAPSRAVPEKASCNTGANVGRHFERQATQSAHNETQDCSSGPDA